MNDEFYTVDDCSEAVAVIHNVEDCFKYVYASFSSGRNSDVPLTEELRKAYKDIRDACLELVNSFDYYNNVHNTTFPSDSDEFLHELANRTKAFAELREANYEKVFKYQD